MARCNFNKPDIISGYFEGTLSEKEKKLFSEHLLTCRECMESLQNLEREIFLMHTIPFTGIPEHKRGKKALFYLMEQGLKLLINLEGKNVFLPVRLLPVRGKEVYQAYSLKSGDIYLNIVGREGKKFDLEIGGVKGKELILYKGDRIVEAHHSSSEEKVNISDLRAGEYSLRINRTEVVSFNIEAE